MMRSGYGLVDKKTGAVLARWTKIPERVNLSGGDVVFGAAAGWETETHRIVEHRWEVADPAPVRRRVMKSTILSRLTDEQIDAALAGATNRQKERWRAADHPSVYADDPELISLLEAIGADPKTVLAGE